jgi:hypothetical protein
MSTEATFFMTQNFFVSICTYLKELTLALIDVSGMLLVFKGILSNFNCLSSSVRKGHLAVFVWRTQTPPPNRCLSSIVFSLYPDLFFEFIFCVDTRKIIYPSTSFFTSAFHVSSSISRQTPNPLISKIDNFNQVIEP